MHWHEKPFPMRKIVIANLLDQFGIFFLGMCSGALSGNEKSANWLYWYCTLYSMYLKCGHLNASTKVSLAHTLSITHSSIRSGFHALLNKFKTFSPKLRLHFNHSPHRLYYGCIVVVNTNFSTTEKTSPQAKLDLYVFVCVVREMSSELYGNNWTPAEKKRVTHTRLAGISRAYESFMHTNRRNFWSFQCFRLAAISIGDYRLLFSCSFVFSIDIIFEFK